MTDSKVRCPWAGRGNELYLRYHDQEWGNPSRDDRHLFELLILEGAQAGLSWATVLNKRAAYRLAMDGFDPERMAAYGAADRQRLLADAGIIRNRLKIDAAIGNARAFLEVQERHDGFHRYLWSFVDGRPVVNHWTCMEQVPASTPASERLSRDLRKRGFKFVGPTICYAFMQATGMVNDHLVSCFRHGEVSASAH